MISKGRLPLKFKMPFHYDRAAKVEFDSACPGSIAAVRKTPSRGP